MRVPTFYFFYEKIRQNENGISLRRTHVKLQREFGVRK
ncbi:hypothetical protein LEP1GSC037_5727 [Leptospira interrogans str. 2006001854]|uniref:Uncharacterized protein n=1 Tax=Leptospira interrogans str. 2006001854 TaxID=1001590 RepID=M6GFU1_LEPIR|nr:hypothetical protein LEP1GSC037_5727 [Leptospira interrogans str. 2006001854]